ncbi:hypothetical protein DRN69_07655 [Candidatus Pacearchaeota archaeon]|nr:MAG: hypothetical protein DRN69_07655 [Candidatus Pacearchaeota archaeon]
MSKEVSVAPKTEKERSAEEVFQEKIIVQGQEMTIKELIEMEVKKRLEERMKRRPVGLRRKAIKRLCEIIYTNYGSVVKTQKELRELASKVAEEVGIKFTFWPAIRNGYIHKIVHKDPEAGTVRIYVLSQKAFDEFGLTQPAESVETEEVAETEAETEEEAEESEAVEEEIEKALEE